MHYVGQIICVFIVGVGAGIINIMAGGGSVLTLGTLMMCGLDASVANGSNRIGLMLQNISGATTYKRQGICGFRSSIGLYLCAVPGAMIGALCAIQMTNVMFQRILGVVMIGIIITLFLPKPSDDRVQVKKVHGLLLYPAMVIIGFYGGFIQAGIGFIIMAVFYQLTEKSLVQINMHKIHIILVYTIPVLFLFGMTKNINWVFALILAGGNAFGAWIAVRLSLKKGDMIIKRALAVAILLMALKFFLI